MPELNRRSFLAILAGALTVDPKKLVKRAAAPSKNPIIEGWINQHWTVWDTFVLKPGEAIHEVGFFPPLPDNFAISRLRTFVDAETEVDDLVQIFEGVGLELTCDGRVYLAAPLSVVHTPMVGESMPLFPALRPADNFNVKLFGSPNAAVGRNEG